LRRDARRIFGAPVDPSVTNETRCRGCNMWLLALYVVLMIVGDLLSYAIVTFFVEPLWPAAGLTTFLALYFGFLWLAWVVAVWLTEPKILGRFAGTR
jgi:hypothetical protein